MAFHQVKCYNSLCSSIDWHIPECCCLWYAMKRFHSSLYLLFSESFSIEEFHSNISECFINTPIWVSFNCHFASFLSRWAANRHFMGHFPCFECCLRGLFLSCFPHGKISVMFKRKWKNTMLLNFDKNLNKLPPTSNDIVLLPSTRFCKSFVNGHLGSIRVHQISKIGFTSLDSGCFRISCVVNQ